MTRLEQVGEGRLDAQGHLATDLGGAVPVEDDVAAQRSLDLADASGEPEDGEGDDPDDLTDPTDPVT